MDNTFLDTLNNKAVALYKNNKSDKAIDEFKKIVKVNYKYISAHHMLLKISQNQSGSNFFWNYWQDSRLKKIIALSLIGIMFSIVLFTITIPAIIILSNNNITSNKVFFQSTNEITNTTTITENKTETIINNKTSQIEPSIINKLNSLDVPLYGLITIGIIAIILLSPIIRSASIGTTSLELTTIDRTENKKTELEFVEK